MYWWTRSAMALDLATNSVDDVLLVALRLEVGAPEVPPGGAGVAGVIPASWIMAELMMAL